MLLMARRIRLIIDTDEDVRLAVKLAAMKRNVGRSELVTAILRDALKEEVADAQKYLPRKASKKEK